MQCLRLPHPRVAPEHRVGDGLEGRGVHRRIPSDSGEHRCGPLPRFGNRHGAGVAEEVPATLSATLGVEEESLGARRQHPHAEAPELRIAEMVGMELPRFRGQVRAFVVW